MTEVISVKFSGCGKAYFFEPNGITANIGDRVIVDTANGMDIGECSVGNHQVPDECVVQPLRPVLRIATDDDLRIAAANREREKQAYAICRDKIADHGLDMKLVNVEIGFEGNKILFFFTSDGRVDFRELVKDLASVFRTRIELRQIGVRDETKMLGGLGICGRPYCCTQFLKDFAPVSTKMAKTQSLSLNPTKISGSCGRLMCCLRYEQDAYDELVKTIPKNGAFVETIAGYGNVTSSNTLRQTIKVRLDEGEETKQFEADQVAVVPGGRPKPGDELPKVLHYVAKAPEEKEVEEDPWRAPVLFAEEHELGVDEGETTAPKTSGSTEEGERSRRNPNNQNRSRRRPKGGGGQNQQGANRPKQPGQQGAKPGAQGTKPGAQGTKPGAQGAKPGAQGAKPGAQGAKPGAQGAKPGAKPAGQQNQPKQRQGQNQNRQQQKPRPEQGGEKANAEAAPKKNNYNRNRRRPNKPRAEGGAAPQNKE